MTIKIRNKFVFTIILLFSVALVYGQPVPFSSNPFSTNPFGANPKDKRNKKATETKTPDKNLKEKVKEVINKRNVEPSEGSEAIKALGKDDFIDKNEIVTQEDSLITNKLIDTTLKIYGMDFFRNNTYRNSDRTSVAPPPSYKIGVRDEIIVNIWGTSELQQKYIVGRDGSIFPDGIGKIYVQGLTYESARQVVSNKFRNNIAPGSNIDIQMGAIRTIKVSLVGEIVKQGTITVSAFNTAFNCLSLAGGITNLGNLREIQIKRNREVAYTIDLYEFIKTGGNIDDLYLEDGDIIFVGQYEKMVEAKGSFRRPMLYQLKKEEALNNLLDLAGGPSADARASSVSIKSISEESAQLVTINLRDLDKSGDTYFLQDGDVVTLDKIILDVSNTANIKGSVKYPNDYQVGPGERLLDIIRKSGGLTADAFTASAYITRSNASLEENLIKISLDGLTENDYSKNIEIQAADSINIISKLIFTNNYVFDIEGQVKNPGAMRYTDGMTLKDAIILAGGLKSDAEPERIEIASIIDSFDTYNIKVKEKAISRTYTINKNLELEDITSKIKVLPFDKIFIRKKTNFKLMEVVNITGGVKYPGSYPLITPNEKISSLVTRAGGLQDQVSVADGRLTRKVIGRIVLNLEKAMKEPNGKYDIILSDGDEILIPYTNDIVSIAGQVLVPTSMKYEADSAGVKFYINAAGGFDEDPWKDRISVEYSNGQIKTTKRIFFIRKYPPVKPGSIVTVPKKPERKEEEKFDFGKFSALTSSIISSLTAITTIYFILNPPQ